MIERGMLDDEPVMLTRWTRRLAGAEDSLVAEDEHPAEARWRANNLSSAE